MTQNTLKKEEMIWQNSIFMKLFASYSVSMLGHWFDLVAIVILFGYVWQANPMVLALIPVAYALPQVLLGQFAGVLTDRYHKVKIMMAADLMTAVLTAILLFTNTPWTALVIISLRAAVNVVHSPAQQGLIKLVVKENLIMKAVTLNGTVNQLSKIIGPFVGAALVGLVSPKLCILINAIAFTISALILLIILLNKEMTRKTTVPKIVESSDNGFWAEWGQGWKIVFNSKVLFISLLATVIGLTAIQMVDIQFPVLFREIAPSLPELAGWLMGASGLGALVMIIILNRFSTLKKFGCLIGASMLLIGIGFGGVGLLREGFIILLPVSLCFIAGLGVGLLTITFQYIIQTETTEQEIGRISGIVNSAMSFTVLVAPLIGGMLVQSFGISPICITSGIVLAVLGISLMFGNSLLFERSVNEEEEEKVAAAE